MFMSTFTLTLLCCSQEADHLANLGADGTKKITVAKKKNKAATRGGRRCEGSGIVEKEGMVPVGVKV